MQEGSIPMLRRASRDPDNSEDQRLVAGRTLLIVLAAAVFSLIVGVSMAALVYFGTNGLAGPAARILGAAAAGLPAATLTFLKAIDVLHRLVQ
ncbi:hypothetical protein [Lentzea sp. NPDC003310]|uniref:hypothetical protein n=1 Tax=Lentzea sp. NPDC003310 TaxID=3154447 RepID=UPI0033BBFF77